MDDELDIRSWLGSHMYRAGQQELTYRDTIISVVVHSVEDKFTLETKIIGDDGETKAIHTPIRDTPLRLI